MVRLPVPLAKNRGGANTRTNQRRVCRMFPACGPNRKLQCWRRSVDGRQRAAHGVRVAWGSMAPAVPSRSPFREFGEGQAAKVVRGLGCLAARREECAFVGLAGLN